ncbi:MAG: hypothetical protein J7J80_07155 [Thermotogae bacterium]|nr:hypothetical protein [Thermotogota bacterium]
MSKVLAFLFAAGSELLLLLGLIALMSATSYIEPSFEEPINVRLSTIPFVYKTEISTSENTSSFYSYPLVGGKEALETKEPQKIGARLLQPETSPKPVGKGYKLPKLEHSETFASNPFNQLVEADHPAATPTLRNLPPQFKELELEGPGIAKETVIPELVRLESTQQGFRVEDFPNFRQVKAGIERDYTDLLQRRQTDRHQLKGEVVALLTLEPEGNVSVKIEEASAVELASIVVSNLSKLETQPRHEKRTLRVVVLFQN